VFSKRGAAVLEAPEQRYAPEAGGPRRVSASPKRRVRRDLGEDFAGDFGDDLYDDDDPPSVRRKGGVRVRFRGLPTTKWGRIFAGVVVVLLVGFCLSVYLMAKSYVMHEERFVIPSSSSIEFEGNRHVTRAQLLGIFGGDVERNIFTVSLEQRRAELEKLPWVAHATVMRLLPNRMRVSVVERTPVAFVRQGSHIGLVDANGVLLDMPVDSSGQHYSFPVVTGISANDPLSTRAARMKIFQRFTSDLDSSGEAISQELSEVDLSNPEDVKALIPDHSTDILVHFGEDDFLDRYRRFKEHLLEWRAVYPKLYSVDMRYERQVVLEMQPGSGVPVTPAAGAAADDSSVAKTAPPVAAKSVAKAAVKPSGKVVEKAAPKATATAKPNAKAALKVPAVGTKPATMTEAPVQTQKDVAFDVPANKGGAKSSGAKKAKAHVPPAKHHQVVVNSPDVPTQYHPPQVVHP
jgi:cell division protein FtsQ